MKKIVVGLAVMLGFCMCTHKPSGTLDVNRALDYCAEQTQRYAYGTENEIPALTIR